MNNDNLEIKPIELTPPSVEPTHPSSPSVESTPELSAIIVEANKELGNGGVTEETYKKFSNMGISKEMVDGAIKEQADVAIAKAFSFFEGGKAEFDEKAKWAATNFTEAESALYDKYRAKDTNKALGYLKERFDNKVEKNNDKAGTLEARHFTGNTSASADKKEVYSKYSEALKDVSNAIKDGTYNDEQDRIREKINNSPLLQEAE